MKDRLSKLLIKLNLNATRFADEIGVQRSGISHILSGRNQPSFDFIIKILTNYPQISPDWLLLGKGNMLREDHSDQNKPSEEKNLLFPVTSDKVDSKPFSNENAVSISNSKVTNVTAIERVLLLHADGTFDIFLQAKKD